MAVDFWVPLYKYQLLAWFTKHRPEWKQSELRIMPKKRLYAIYFKTRREHDNTQV